MAQVPASQASTIRPSSTTRFAAVPPHVVQLSSAGQQLANELASRYGVSTDGVIHMMVAVRNGGGTMAQFSHPDFGGSGQWMSGGMTMVSDLFNNQLKSLVDNICSEISRRQLDAQGGMFGGSSQSQSQSGSGGQSQHSGGNFQENAGSLFVPDPQARWWPAELGTPAATGSQNNLSYGYFPNSRRLAVKTGSDVWVYDTGDHQIGGFGQQQGGGSSISFSSQLGTVPLSRLPVISKNGQPVDASAAGSGDNSSAGDNSAGNGSAGNERRPEPAAASTPPGASGGGDRSTDDALQTLEKLGRMRDQGWVSEDEFAAKKAELLRRL